MNVTAMLREREIHYAKGYRNGMMHGLLIGLSLWVFTAAVFADQTVTTAPGAYVKIPIPEAGETSEFKLRPDTALMLPTQEWGSGKCVVIFSSPAKGRYYLFVTYDGGKGEVFDIVVGDVPPPGPEPAPPDPEPEPPAPDGLTDFAKDVKAWAADRPAEERTALAGSFSNAANSLSSSATVAQCESTALEMNRSALGAARLDWLPFFRKLQDALLSRKAAGQWSKAEHCIAAYREIAAGLEDA